ncbi:MAG TPA: tetratricopeptide repeat protein [Rhabdochlamydiaceae bacterium]|jgi:outer membrane protein assembly factor BamD (BamD/ComL family)
MLNFFLLFLVLVSPFSLCASYTVKEGRLINSEYVATLSVQEHYSAALQAYQEQKWEEVIQQAFILMHNFASTPFADEVCFYLGAAYFHVGELEDANNYLTQYLKKQATPKFFEEAIQYKFQIAELFHHGAKKHILGWHSMPKWLPAKEEAIAIYDEVLTALPHHELAAHALFNKAQLLLKQEEYKASVETYQTLIRRFPKHPLSVESYIGVAEVYLIQSKDMYPDQDYLDLSEINIKKFKFSFPGEERIAEAEKMFLEMQELFASNLYDTGRFYERTKKPHAAQIYYSRILAKYPATKVAELAAKRLDKLKIGEEEVR